MRLKSVHIATVLGVILTSQAVPQAASAAVCAPHETVVSRLAEAYAEAPRLRGKTSSNRIIEVFASSGFETWTMTVRHSGKTCLIASGKGRSALDSKLANAS